jgi:hypothetical protein
MLNYALSHPNSALRRHVLPLLDDANSTADAQALKQAICDVQLKLDAIHFEVTRNSGGRERVSRRTRNSLIIVGIAAAASLAGSLARPGNRSLRRHEPSPPNARKLLEVAGKSPMR